MILIKMSGITGEINTIGYIGCFAADGFGWGCSRTSNASMAHSGKTEPRMRAATFSKPMDNVSAELYNACWTGDFSHTITINFLRTGPVGPIMYAAFEFSGAGISSIETSSHGDRPVETYTIDYTKINLTYLGFDNTLVGSQMTVEYNLPTNA